MNYQVPWWERVSFDNVNREDVISVGMGKQALQEHALRYDGKPVYDASSGGNLKIPIDELRDRIIRLGGRAVRLDGDDGFNIYVWPRAVLSMHRHSIDYAVADDDLREEFQKLEALYEQIVVERQTTVEVIVTGINGYETHLVPIDAVPLERGNYDPRVLHDYDHVVEDLRSSTPCGRLILLNGSPGTGKTFVVRSLVKSIVRGVTLIVPPQLIAQLDGPAFMNLLIQKKACTQGPMLLIVEDADACVAARGSGNMASISTLLNLSDGLVGSLLDLRILATTNADELALDDALLRPGRLCRHMHVDVLSSKQAREVYHRLGGTGDPNRSMTLAQVYRLALDESKNGHGTRTHDALETSPS